MIKNPRKPKPISSELMKRLMLKSLKAEGALKVRLNGILNRYRRPMTAEEYQNSLHC